MWDEETSFESLKRKKKEHLYDGLRDMCQTRILRDKVENYRSSKEFISFALLKIRLKKCVFMK